MLKATEGAAYAHPEKDGASHWEMEGPAYLPGAPLLESPAVLPMRPDESGEPLIVSGTVRSGLETLGFKPDHSPLTALTQALELPGMRPLHIHAIVSADDFLPLTTQLYFDGDPLVSRTIEGPVPASAVKSTDLHDAPADYRARGLNGPYRTLTHDYALRSAISRAPARTAA
ncbi:hypothetical protein [Nonomuraea sp. NPDC050643]|uniref:dioxygenase family protein n=1 Tax=Nonomuraea sp. NPDC050643 TaxID=3155660 RepID=UPI0033FAB5A2